MDSTHRAGTTARVKDLRHALDAARLFRGIGLESIEYLLPSCQILEIEAGAALLRQHTHNDCVFVLLSGSLQVHLLQPPDQEITTIREGECAGEMSVIDGGAVSADVIADQASRVLRIPQDVLWSMVGASHGLARNLLCILSTRMRFDHKLIVESLHARREFEQAAQTDALTGLHNRRWLNDAFARQVARCSEDGQDFCLLMIDIDHFKRINDSDGHVAGDHALVAVAAALTRHIRPMDLLVRFGGEEFALGLPGTDCDEALMVAERLRHAIECLALPFRNSHPLPHLTVSLGVAQMQQGQTLDALIAAADAALYRAKDGGRNRVAI